MATSNWTAETSWDNISATTLDHYFDGTEDIFFKDHPFERTLWKKRKVVRGGKKLSKVLETADAASSGTFDLYYVLDTVPADFFKQASVPSDSH